MGRADGYFGCRLAWGVMQMIVLGRRLLWDLLWERLQSWTFQMNKANALVEIGVFFSKLFLQRLIAEISAWATYVDTRCRALQFYIFIDTVQHISWDGRWTQIIGLFTLNNIRLCWNICTNVKFNLLSKAGTRLLLLSSQQRRLPELQIRLDRKQWAEGWDSFFFDDAAYEDCRNQHRSCVRRRTERKTSWKRRTM